MRDPTNTAKIQKYVRGSLTNSVIGSEIGESKNVEKIFENKRVMKSQMNMYSVRQNSH